MDPLPVTWADSSAARSAACTGRPVVVVVPRRQASMVSQVRKGWPAYYTLIGPKR
jgi:hypothetical protein